MSKALQVATYLPPRIFKLLSIEAANRGTTKGQIISEAVLAWFKFLRKEEIIERKERNELAEIDKLEKEAEGFQTELDLLLKEYETKKQNKKRGRRK